MPMTANDISGGMPRAGSSGGSMSTGYLTQQTQQYAAARAGIQQGIPMVYLGGQEAPYQGAALASMGNYGVRPPQGMNLRSVIDMMNRFNGTSVDKKHEMAMRLAKAGFLGMPRQGETLEEYVKTLPLQAVEEAYQGLLSEAAAQFAAGNRITPNQILDHYTEYNERIGIFGADGKGEAGFTGTKKQTSTSTHYYDEADAKGMVRAILRNELDRDPTEQEFEDFVSALNAQMKANPSTTTTRYRYENGELVDQSSVTHGGMTEAGVSEFLTQEAQAQPGWAEWQAAGQLFPAVMQMLGAGVQGV